nr:nuclear transport factor 2 family protein [Bacteroides pyogenes]
MASAGRGGFVGRLQRQAERFRPFGKDGSTEQCTFAIDQVDYVTENGNLVVASVGFAVSANGHSMEMKGVDLFRFENGLIKEVWLFSERIDEEDCFWTSLSKS